MAKQARAVVWGNYASHAKSLIRLGNWDGGQIRDLGGTEAEKP